MQDSIETPAPSAGLKAVPKPLSLKELAQAYVIARREKDHWTSEAERLQLTLAERMDDEKLDKIRCEIDDGGIVNPVTVSLTEPRCFVSVKQGDFATLKAWLAGMGSEGLVREAIHPATLSAFVKEKVEEGVAVPEWMNVHYKPSVRVLGLNGGAERE